MRSCSALFACFTRTNELPLSGLKIIPATLFYYVDREGSSEEGFSFDKAGEETIGSKGV